MSNDSKTTDPRVEAGAKAWDKQMGGRYSPHEVEELAEEVAVILAAADAVDTRKPRIITTVEELDALPTFSVIRTSGTETEIVPRVAVKTGVWMGKSEWSIADEAEWAATSDELDDLPATVLYEPQTEATR